MSFYWNFFFIGLFVWIIIHKVIEWKHKSENCNTLNGKLSKTLTKTILSAQTVEQANEWMKVEYIFLNKQNQNFHELMLVKVIEWFYEKSLFSLFCFSGENKRAIIQGQMLLSMQTCASVFTSINNERIKMKTEFEHRNKLKCIKVFGI